MSVDPVNPAVEALFSALNSRQTRQTALAQTALSAGADRALKGDYEGAVREFKRAIGLDSSPENAAKAYDLLATSYIQLGKTDDAIKAYKASISMAPSDDNAHLKLGNIYFSQKRYSDAEQEYKAAVRLNPSSSTNHLSLGQAYLASGRTAEAEIAFKRVIQMSPHEYGGYYALGQAYAREGRQTEAIDQFRKVIELKQNFYQVRVDLGSAYADLGEMDDAQKELTVLNDNAPDIAPVLSGYIDKVTKPKILAAYNTSGFVDTLGPGTPADELDPSLAAPNASHLFNMVFVFSKDMDASSVQSVTNWSILRADGSGPGGAYDWGLPAPSTDVRVSPIPLSVVYMPESMTATVSFLVNQNQTADGTIDTSHLDFKFSGTDANGNAMDSSADEYSGISMIA